MTSSPHSSRGERVLADSVEQREQLPSKPSLLPAFEPLSSSPFPRPQSAKRKFGQDSPSFRKQQLKYYPTPVPTSSTGILHSSSPRNEHVSLARSISALSERVPLGDLPSVHLPANGEVIRMGRSSNSSDYQLSANRLISRVHVQAAYHSPNASSSSPWVEVECMGWNGAKIHCRGCVYDLPKGAVWMSEDPAAEIMLDVQDARVLILWPTIPSQGNFSWDSDDSETTPTRRPAVDHFASSPPIIPRSPVSQSPVRQPVFAGLTLPPLGQVQVFEDADAGQESPAPTTPSHADEAFIRSAASRSVSLQESDVPKAQPSFLSSFTEDDFSDGDEENDPVVHSFGPFGENLLPRFESFSATTPNQVATSSQRSRRLVTAQSPRRPSFQDSPIRNHVINQLAWSRLHSQPLSAIHGNLPAELRACATKSSDKSSDEPNNALTPTPQLTSQHLKQLMDDIPCVGEISRSGKDAAGKPLENEFYYVPEMDTDTERRDAVTGNTRGSGLRTVRKSHKQYYWKRPRH